MTAFGLTDQLIWKPWKKWSSKHLVALI
jgi:hypothetical protein